MKQSLFAQRMKLKKEIPQSDEQLSFPQTFKVDLPPQPNRAQFHGLSEKEYQQIEEENLKAIKEMNQEQVLELQKQIRESLGDNLCKMFESGDIYQIKQQKQMQLEINQNITKNTEVFSKLIDEDQITISEIQELIKSPEMSSVKVALQKIDKVIKPQNVLQLESINLSDYLISVGKSTNISVSLFSFDLLYSYWNKIVPNCWNPIYNLKETKEVEDLYVDLPQMVNQLQHHIPYSKALDLLRIRNILSQSNSKYIIEHQSIVNIDCKLKSIILLQQFQELQQINFISQEFSDFLLSIIFYYFHHLLDSQCNIIISELSKVQNSNLKLAIFYLYQSRFSCKLIHEPLILDIKKPEINQDIQIYEIVPFQSVIATLFDSFNLAIFSGQDIVICLKQIVSLIFDIRYLAKQIISRKQRKVHKWRLLNILRSIFQEQFKNEANKRTSIKENNEKYQLLELIRQQLKIEFHLKDEKELVFEASLYTGLSQFLSQHEYQLEVVQQYIDCFHDIDFEIKSEFVLLKLYKLLISNNELPTGLINIYKYLLDKINIKELGVLLNKNVSYFEKLLQKCQYDSYYNQTHVNILFLFISPHFNPDFHNLLFQEFQCTPILQYLSSDIYLKHLNYFTVKPNKGLEIYRQNVLDISSENEFIQKWKAEISQW
ncbi:unnamed protein product [Paramecium octaurelia]|uniref:RPAP1 N-terminal domain-containing protein n=1 Tax=Paramecium octaurelia TaxID=43137 RepID=A0A8S1WH00_PAROT|nr:unnamed protein product [Paramecium octaurelia]